MLQSNVGFLNESGSWDSGCARKFLRIPEDQLEIINKIPGWSKTEIPEKTAAENSPITEKQLTEQASKSIENILTTNHSAKDSSDIKHQNYNSDLQLKQKPVVSLSEKKITLACSLKRSSSFPNLQEQSQFSEALPHCKSEEILRKLVFREEKALSKSEPYIFDKKALIKTSIVPSEDNRNQDKISKMTSLKSFSCPLEHPNRLSKQRNFEKLDDNILNHKYLKDFNSTSSVKSDVPPLFSESAEKPKMSAFEKKLLLLEKRFSPCKETSSPLCREKLKSVEYLNHENNIKSTVSSTPADEALMSRANHDLIQNEQEKTNKSSMPKSNKSLTDSQPSIEMLKNASESVKHTGDAISNTLSSNSEVSFISQPIPCGQPLPTEALSISQSNPLLKSAEINLPTKSQNAELPVKVTAPVKPSAAFSVFSSKSDEKVSDVASGKELSNKRKRRSKSEKSSKKLDAKKLKRINVQFSPAQIRNMVEILKILHV